MLKRFICIALCFVFLLGLCACGTVNTQPSFDKKAGSAPLSDKLIAENTTYKLEWNEENYGVILTNKLLEVLKIIIIVKNLIRNTIVLIEYFSQLSSFFR